MVVEGVERGQHEDRRRDTGGAQLPADLAAVEVGQQQIENDQLAPAPRAPQGIAAVPGDIHVVALGLEPAQDELDDALVVLNQQHVHRSGAVSGKRQAHAHGRAASDLALDGEVAAVGFHDRLRDMQPESRSGWRHLGRVRASIEAAGHQVQLVGRNADAGVAHGHHRIRRLAARLIAISPSAGV